MLSSHAYTPSGKIRGRGIGIPFVGEPGPANAITDVPAVEVGYCTLIEGDGPLVVGNGPIRTGVTAIIPRGRARAADGVFAGYFSFNGNGEMTGCAWVEETGRCEGPITITNTHSVGVARDATIAWLVERFPESFIDGNHFALPIAAETYDGVLNDINGFHVKAAHVFQAIDSANGGPIDEGSVGGGTGMECYQFKGGSGTASRLVQAAGRPYTVGAFVQANFGLRHLCTIAGVPIGQYLPKSKPIGPASTDAGSIIGIVATDAPLLPHQLKRMARRCASGIARSGAVPSHSSGDLFLAFSTGNTEAYAELQSIARAQFVPDFQMSPLFEATVQAVDEAVINAIVGNETMVGRDGNVVEGLPIEKLRELLRQHGRLVEATRP